MWKEIGAKKMYRRRRRRRGGRSEDKVEEHYIEMLTQHFNIIIQPTEQNCKPGVVSSTPVATNQGLHWLHKMYFK